MTYRFGTLDDMESLIDLRLAYLNEDNGQLSETQEKTVRNALPDYYKKHLNNDAFSFVCEEDGKIVSTVMLVVIEKPANQRFPFGMTGEVLSVYTKPEYRRQGIARILMEQLIDKAKELQLDIVDLDATKDGYPLYKKVGFEEKQAGYTAMRYVVNKERGLCEQNQKCSN